MNGKQARKLRKKAEEVTVGESIRRTRVMNQAFKIIHKKNK